jgi:tetratricopeptide (TPR) repeat protein
VRLYAQAREHQRTNADYTFRTAQAMIAGRATNPAEILSLLDSAVRRNPMSTEYLLTRARFAASLPDAAERRDAIRADYRRVLELNPNEVSLRLEFADVLKGFGTPEDRAAARREYEEALRFNEMLPANEPKRLKAGRVEEIRKGMEGL